MNYRHGDLGLFSIKELPKDNIEKSNSKNIMIGSHGNSHRYNIGELYISKIDHPFIFGYFIATEETILFHKSHGDKEIIMNGTKYKEAKIKPCIYELRKQNEETHEGMQAILD